MFHSDICNVTHLAFVCVQTIWNYRNYALYNGDNSLWNMSNSLLNVAILLYEKEAAC